MTSAARHGRWGLRPTPALALLAVLALLPMLAACDAAPVPGGPLDRPVLSFDTIAALKANAAARPAGFTGPQQTVCSSDTTRQFVGEVATHGVSDIRVYYQWAPVVAGAVPDRPTVAQPELNVAGEVVEFHHSTGDLAFSHPFGLDAITELRPDADFQLLAHQAGGQLQGELEQGLFPEAAFGYQPKAGDRALLRGAWIFDCGHPPYETELHPPTFVAYARAADALTTTALAFVSPYRVTQLYSHDPARVAQVGDASRFTAADVRPFPSHLIAELLAASSEKIPRFGIHVVLEAVRIESLTFLVCAPSPRPPNVVLDASYRFTARTGVALQVTHDDAAGCLRFVATMDARYTPAVPQRLDREWPWSEINREAAEEAGVTIDVRQQIADALRALGNPGQPEALRDDRPPVIDRYTPLQPRANAAADTPTAITTSADDQPFPLYGRVRVFWR